ncbi:MAG TPA: FliH/SctL family protein [Bryobacteraceae bacterium]|nr:FliH/SctL family protein [Bryobacteraceae bacterium]
MSCRVFTGVDSNAVPLFKAPTPHSAPQPFKVEAGSSTPEPDVAREEIEGLQARIAGLEARLGAEVLKAREAGFQAGQAAGFERGREEVRPVIERITRSIADLSGLRGRIRQDAERDLIELAIAIARRVLRRELSVDPEAVHGLVKAALGKVPSREVRRVRVHPDLAGMVRRQIESAGLSGVEISSDGALTPGDVIVETRNGDLDASIDVQLAEIQRGFADRLRR